MKDRPCFLATLLAELASQQALSAGRDWDYIQSRYEHEGISFLTITLPTFCDGLLKSIEDGFVTPSNFPAFSRRRGSCLPKFLSGFMDKVFAPCGTLMSDADPDCIYSIRQICRFFKKADMECSKERFDAAIQKYVATDLELKNANSRIIEGQYDEDSYLCRVSSLLVRSLFSDFNRNDVRGKHGKGATADGLSRHERVLIREWPIRAEPYFPSCYHTIPNIGWINNLRGVRLLSEEEERPVKIVAVPKTLKSPRIIAMEPHYMMYMQQACMSEMVSRIEKHRLTCNSIRFSDQSVNRESARIESMNKNRATIDLSEASDRVSIELVRRIFDGVQLREFLLACRSSKAQLPDGTTLVLEKFASQGSANCFPVEAFVFYCLIQAAMHERRAERPTHQSITRLSRLIDVYGDDLIVPVHDLSCVVDKLEGYGLKVNASKSFSKSNFRESCGGDFYNGYAVKPVYLRVDPTRINDPSVRASTVLSLIETSNQLYLLGLWKTCREMRDHIQTLLTKEYRNGKDYRRKYAKVRRRLTRGLQGSFDPIAVPKMDCRRAIDIPTPDVPISFPSSGRFGYVSCQGASYTHWDKSRQVFKARSLVPTLIKGIDRRAPWISFGAVETHALRTGRTSRVLQCEAIHKGGTPVVQPDCGAGAETSPELRSRDFMAVVTKSISNIGNVVGVDWYTDVRSRDLSLKLGWVY